MRDKVIAVSAVAVAGLAVTVGLTIGALGGAFDDSDTKVAPPALRSDLSTAVNATSSGIVVPPSPTWQVAVPTTPRVTTTTPAPSSTTAQSTAKSTAQSTTRTSRERPRTSKASESESATTTR
ncbi:hypothetical protein QMK17_18180 [Rhodococcus sp. G-MC3]|uniref:hypothetical protein n=1 Tax=Rhodococcus sp. G-MC3 TaxID=3046209 RepID=UPI0024B9CD43|nr:hypothetical protein [Rhodococcus sp. G-MC3]MDJ0395258.1 hypothetical protein [Rhodococcus sp. G-MC3]